VLTDEGLINTKWRTNSAVDFENSFIEDQVRKLNEPYVVLEIYSSHHVQEVIRTYDKVQDLLGQVGGISSLLSMIVGLLYNFYNKSKMRLHLLNKSMLKVKSGGRKTNLMEGELTRYRYKLYFSDIPKISCFGCLSLCRLKKCFSKST
jgi:hypothetical protein